jgi:Fe-S-cluster containining protein
VSLDCRRCGACCCNTRENLAEGFTYYVEVEEPRPALQRWLVHDPEGVPHMRMDGSRCSALTGKLGVRVSCQVYAHRPRGCRRVTPGDRACLQARADWGLD